MRIVLFGTYDEALHPRVAVLREGLQAHGHDVVTCNHPSGVSTSERVAAAKRPWLASKLICSMISSLIRLRRAARAMKAVDVVVVGYLGVFDIHAARRWFEAPVVLDHLAPVSGTLSDRRMGGFRVRVARWIDARAEHAADLIITDTPEQRSQLSAESQAKAVVVPVGVPSSWFQARTSAETEGEPLAIVFFGLYTPLQGTKTIARAITATPPDAATWTLVGTGQDRGAVDRLVGRCPNVTKLDWVDPAGLPELVASHDVCLGIFGEADKALRVVPNKVFQGAATGAVIITSDTECQRRALGPNAIFVEPGDSSALANAVRELASDRDRLRTLRESTRAWADVHFRPRAVVVPLVRALAVLEPRHA